MAPKGHKKKVAKTEPEVESDSGDDSDHDSHCSRCGKEGMVMCCDGCHRVYHLRCVGLRELPADDWFCENCEKERKEGSSNAMEVEGENAEDESGKGAEKTSKKGRRPRKKAESSEKGPHKKKEKDKPAAAANATNRPGRRRGRPPATDRTSVAGQRKLRGQKDTKAKSSKETESASSKESKSASAKESKSASPKENDTSAKEAKCATVKGPAPASLREGRAGSARESKTAAIRKALEQAMEVEDTEEEAEAAPRKARVLKAKKGKRGGSKSGAQAKESDTTPAGGGTRGGNRGAGGRGSGSKGGRGSKGGSSKGEGSSTEEDSEPHESYEPEDDDAPAVGRKRRGGGQSSIPAKRRRTQRQSAQPTLSAEALMQQEFYSQLDSMNEESRKEKAAGGSDVFPMRHMTAKQQLVFYEKLCAPRGEKIERIIDCRRVTRSKRPSKRAEGALTHAVDSHNNGNAMEVESEEASDPSGCDPSLERKSDAAAAAMDVDDHDNPEIIIMARADDELEEPASSVQQSVEENASGDRMDVSHGKVGKGDDQAHGDAEEEDEEEWEYYIKWQGFCYRKCTWETEAVVDSLSHIRLRNFLKNLDADVEGTGGYDQAEEYKTVERLIARESLSNGAVVWLVKWNGLSYEEATWELDEWLQPEKELVEKYERVNDFAACQERVQEIVLPDEDTVHTWMPFQVQPDYLDGGGTLRDYQLVGLNWLRKAWYSRTNVILADQPGLGKTIQTIAFLSSIYSDFTPGPFFVIVPLSTLNNWKREFEIWAPYLNVITYTGSRKAREVIRATEFYFAEQPHKRGDRFGCAPDLKHHKFNVLLTSYETAIKDDNVFSSCQWAALVVDEAHMLKNNESKRFRTLSSIKAHFRLFLTGTPLQNNLQELFYLLHFLNPTKFSSLEEFQMSFHMKDKDDQLKKLHAMLNPHILRRAKSDVEKSIPPKSEFILRVELAPLQKKYYKAILTRNVDALVKGARMSLINIMVELQKCCNHPYLFRGAEPEEVDGTDESLKLMIESCGKLQLLDKMLEKLKATGHRVLVFSQMTRVLDILEDYMCYKYVPTTLPRMGHYKREGDIIGHLQYESAWSYQRLDGSVKGSDRQQRIDAFNQEDSSAFVFLLSTRAGGQGINLATADTVIIYDSDWNPHNDIQALGRAHRIGQQNKVMIYRLITRGTMEEELIQRSKHKLMLEHLVVEKLSKSKGASIPKEELNRILKFGSKDLFEDDAEEGRITYDDDAITALLDRERSLGTEESEDGDTYLNSFKVADYNKETEKQERATNEFWNELLRPHATEEMLLHEASLGKGKRDRRQVNYSDDVLYSDVKSSETSSRRAFSRDTVLGFSAQQRAVFLNQVLNRGTKVLTDSERGAPLRSKSDAVVKEYWELFLEHILEPVVEGATFFDAVDGTPKEFSPRTVIQKLINAILIENKANYIRQHPDEPFEVRDNNWTTLHLSWETGPWNPELDKELILKLDELGFRRWSAIVRECPNLHQVALARFREEKKSKVESSTVDDEDTLDPRALKNIKDRSKLLEQALFVEFQLNTNEEELADMLKSLVAPNISKFTELEDEETLRKIENVAKVSSGENQIGIHNTGLVAREDQTEDHGKEARKFVRMFAQSYDLAQALDFDRVEFHVLEAIEELENLRRLLGSAERNLQRMKV